MIFFLLIKLNFIFLNIQVSLMIKRIFLIITIMIISKLDFEKYMKIKKENVDSIKKI